MLIVTVANFEIVTDAVNGLVNILTVFIVPLGASFALRFVEDLLGLHT